MVTFGPLDIKKINSPKTIFKLSLVELVDIEQRRSMNHKISMVFM